MAKILFDEGVTVIKNLKELTTYWTAENGFDKVSAPDKQVWKDNALSTVKTIQFYDQWSVYLHDVLPFMHILNAIPSSIMKLLYLFSSSMEELFDKIFILFGLFNYLTDTTTWIGKFYFWGRYLGMAIFVVLIIARVTLSFIGGSFKYKEFFNNLILVSFALNVLPTALVASGNMISYATTTLRTHSSSSSSAERQTLSLTPIKSNVVDLFHLIDEDFDTNKLEYDPHTKYIRKDASELNDIKDSNLQQTKFESFIGASTEELLNYYIYKDDDKKQKRTSADEYYGVATLLTSSKQVGETKKDGRMQYVIAGIEVSSMFGVDFSMFSPVYPRYKVDYFSIFIQQTMLIALFAGLLVSMTMTIYKVLLSSMVAPFVAYTSVDDSTKFMELLQSMFSGIAGFFFEIAIVHFSLWFLKNSQIVAMGKSTLLSNLGWFGKSMMLVLLYIATYLGAMQGSGAIKSWLGVSTGARSGASTLQGLSNGTSALFGTGAVLGAGYLANKTGQRSGIGQKGRNNPVSNGLGIAKKLGSNGASSARRLGGLAGNGIGRFAGSVANLHTGAKSHMSASGVGYAEGLAKTMGERAIVGSHNAFVGAKTGARKAARSVNSAKTNVKSAYKKATAPVSQGYSSARHGLTKMKATPLGANKRVGNSIKVPRNVMNDYKNRIDQNRSKMTESGEKPVNTISYKKGDFTGNQGHQNSVTDLPNVTGEVEEF